MKKKLVILLALVLTLFGTTLTMAEEADEAEKGEEAIINEATTDAFVECFKEFCKEYFADKAENEAANLDVDTMEEEIAELSPEEAYREYAKTCAMLAAVCYGEGVTITNAYGEYSSVNFLTAMMLADDVFTVVNDIEDTSSEAENDITVVRKCREAYREMGAYIELWDVLSTKKPDVPEEYEALDRRIEGAKGNISEMYDYFTSLGDESEVTAFSVWIQADIKLDSMDVNVLRAMYFADDE